jgi:acyl carrier protein
MSMDSIEQVRRCIQRVRPETDTRALAADTPLLECRVISSFDIVELILHLEQIRGRRVRREQLVPGSFRDLATIARVFLDEAEFRQ